MAKPSSLEAPIADCIKTEMKRLEASLKQLIDSKFSEFLAIRKQSLLYRLQSSKKTKEILTQTDPTPNLEEPQAARMTSLFATARPPESSIFGTSLIGGSVLPKKQETNSFMAPKPLSNMPVFFGQKEQIGASIRAMQKNQEAITKKKPASFLQQTSASEIHSNVSSIGKKRRFLDSSESFKKPVPLSNPSISMFNSSPTKPTTTSNTTLQAPLFGKTASLFSNAPTMFPMKAAGTEGQTLMGTRFFGSFAFPQVKSSESMATAGQSKSSEMGSLFGGPPKSDGGIFGSVKPAGEISLSSNQSDLPAWLLESKKPASIEVLLAVTA
eukprot:TRINITY_DN14263_c0_g1_i1.p1 TRINITY_DN14263_c0_g1~~TRINITY_DN14263_c0_g1_i1.p1  ORF type:complete len:357 (-),score=40.87 TRINITY_DN14263_c0_g1_i1:143-1120(-)